MPRTLGSRDCIVCGQQNPVGMRLRFAVDERGAETRWLVAESFQGFRGVLHGGLVLALCDDAMWYAAYGKGGVTLTAEATVRYRARVPIGANVIVRGWVAERRGRLWQCAAEIADAGDGTVLATAQGKFLPVPDRDFEQVVGETRVHELPADDPTP